MQSASGVEARKPKPAALTSLSSQQMDDLLKFPPCTRLSSSHREIEPQPFEAEVEHAQNFYSLSVVRACT